MLLPQNLIPPSKTKRGAAAPNLPGAGASSLPFPGEGRSSPGFSSVGTAAAPTAISGVGKCFTVYCTFLNINNFFYNYKCMYIAPKTILMNL